MGSPRTDPVVLVIDDEPAVCDLFARVLGTAGFFPVVAYNSEAALRLIERGLNPDAILLDLVMPGMGGLGFLLQIRSHPQLGRVPVAIVTGDSVLPPSLQQVAKALNADIYFKPLNMDTILGLAEALVGSALRAEPDHAERQ